MLPALSFIMWNNKSPGGKGCIYPATYGGHVVRGQSHLIYLSQAAGGSDYIRDTERHSEVFINLKAALYIEFLILIFSPAKTSYLLI